MDEGQMKQTAAEVGAAVMGVAGAVAAGYYFYASEDAAQNRKKVSKLAREMKAEIVKKTGKLKDMNRKEVLALVADATVKFQKAKTANKTELLEIGKELKANWTKLTTEAERTAKRAKAAKKKAVASATKEVKKVAKKVAKKIAKK